MSDQRPKRDSMSLEEATVSNMWEIAAADVLLPDGTDVIHILGKAGWRVSHDKRDERLTRSHDPSRLEPLTLPDLGS